MQQSYKNYDRIPSTEDYLRVSSRLTTKFAPLESSSRVYPKMAHSGHGGMDMDSERCSMHVRCSIPFFKMPLTVFLADAFHLGHEEPLHRLPMVAHPRQSQPHRFSPRHRGYNCWVRSTTLGIKTIRKSGYEEA